LAEVRVLGGSLRRLLGERQLRIEAARVSDLLDLLVERRGPDLARVVFADPAASRPTPHRDLRVLVNGRHMHLLHGLETELMNDDLVTLHLAGARSFPGG
jgi:molybdopterin converting factor small subunit